MKIGGLFNEKLEKQKMVIFTPILDPSAHNHNKGRLIKVSIINL